ncbi:hypothetical protein FACS189459_2420 [Bacilli bacterium]|nr:hypothetical protein FACS189459_2420 [Bacilli bacterium]
MGLKHLDKTGLLNVKIPVIDLYIQKQIATFLDNKCSKIDKLIELHKKKLELLGEYKKSLINECVNDGIPGMKIEERERIRMKYLNNGIFTGLNPRDNFVLNDDNACIYYVTTKDLDGRNILLTSGCDKVTKRAKNIINSRSKIAIGDVLFSCIGTIGRTGLIKNKPDN